MHHLNLMCVCVCIKNMPYASDIVGLLMHIMILYLIYGQERLNDPNKGKNNKPEPTSLWRSIDFVV